MRLLMVCPCLPDPGASHGGGTQVGLLAEALARRCELGLVALRRPGEEAPALAEHFAWMRTEEIREKRHQQGLQRPLGQLRMLGLWGCRGLPLVAAKHWQPALVTALAAARAEFRPGASLVEFAPMAQYLPALGDGPTLFTDHEAGVPGASPTGLGAWADRRDLRLWRRYVQHYYPLADRLQALSHEDAARLRGQLGRPVGVRPAIITVPERAAAPGAAPPRALFLGDYRHAPNPEAARRIALQILPRIRRALPEAELWLAGPHEEVIASLRQLPGVRVLGFAPDLDELFDQVRLLLAPVYSGAGVRIKNLLALAHGVPVVTNALGAQGLDATADGRRISESDDDLGAAALELLRSPGAAEEAGRAARVWAEQHLSPDAVADAQLQAVRECATNGG